MRFRLAVGVAVALALVGCDAHAVKTAGLRFVDAIGRRDLDELRDLSSRAFDRDTWDARPYMLDDVAPAVWFAWIHHDVAPPCVEILGACVGEFAAFLLLEIAPGTKGPPRLRLSFVDEDGWKVDDVFLEDGRSLRDHPFGRRR